MTSWQENAINYLRTLIAGMEAETIEVQELSLDFGIDNVASRLDYTGNLQHTGQETLKLVYKRKEQAVAFDEAVESNLLPDIPRYLQR